MNVSFTMSILAFYIPTISLCSFFFLNNAKYYTFTSPLFTGRCGTIHQFLNFLFFSNKKIDPEINKNYNINLKE
jgi:hypothetical protein